ncbi:MAG: radical SAM protein [Candidatus Thermoplasmatota archaeon]|nr:radical SAM protein [Candidatus Thermoplasmatota archaeon]
MPVKFTHELMYSCRGRPPLGCRYCDRGSKMVLYITGICACDCFYCPLSEEKKDNDVIYANERRIDGPGWEDRMIEEVRRMSALGTGITGGDPLMFPERTISAIDKLKGRFGRRHHIHLYTSMPPSESLARSLASSGLNEIRFHPPMHLWSRFEHLGPGATDGDPGDAALFHDAITYCGRSGMDVGIEIPSVPDGSDDLKAMISYALRSGMGFMNINELESSHTNADAFRRKGYALVEDSMAVSGSREHALHAIDESLKLRPGSITVLHLCSSTYKDSVQLRNRLKRTAKNVRRPYEMVTEDGTLLVGVIETMDPSGSVSYLSSDLGVPGDMMEADVDSVRIAPWILSEISAYLNEDCYISERYPTYDALEVERIPV